MYLYVVTEFKWMVKKSFSEVTYEVGSDERLKITANAMEKRKCKKEKKKKTLNMHKTSRNLYFILRAMESNLIRKMT